MALAVNALSMSNTILVLARDTASSISATSGFKGYGIPYELVIVPQAGISLPVLNGSSSQGSYGGFVVLGEVSYDYGGSWRSALSPEQWQQLYDYQNTFGARMVRLDVYPGPDFGAATAIDGAGCCNAGVEQLVSISNATSFPTANLKEGATISTQGLWHYPAKITDSSKAIEVAQFSPGGSFTTATTAAVINSFGRRQQMVWFTSWATDWSPTSNFLQHAFIHWVTRGIFVGHRRLYLSTQIDDVHLGSELYQPAGTTFRIRPGDLQAHVSWTQDINSRMPSGSDYFIELAHNGNGDIEAAINAEANANTKLCNPDSAIDYPEQIDTSLEFQKPLGTGTNIWPASPNKYSWSLACAKLDPLASWIMTPSNRDAFAHVSHTFTHAALNNATYSDVSKEISFNIAWSQQVSLSAGKRYSGKGLVPPAITGLHNGDAIKAWMDNGITSVVGDNTRPPLMNTENEFWPLISNVPSNGYAGLLIIPRWATTIYYNCDLAECTTQEWINTSGGSGDFNTLLENARVTNTRHLLGLHQDPFMFHQANMRQMDVPNFTVGPKSGKMSLLMIWTEVIVQEMTRLTSWPITTLKHDDIATLFKNRMARDQCRPSLSYTLSDDASSIVGVTVGSNSNTCSVPIPVTFPGSASTTAGGTTSEKIGSDPLTIWTPLSGSPVSFQLGTPVRI
ncbi:hypothetical protein C7974DRAFT_322017 [Boeremia exigua]|uniref:uncharacterized protein n=1 Tax=Boeremia exigua TaxID=749465 RepID=UPI001E8CD815|nr:uncharacterized protein C7974DRAFT_322017 [Boeremia exigua]KAH6612971.1 hypothetical protein C7974DRAFT_322017 [Boeremia exigua]